MIRSDFQDILLSEKSKTGVIICSPCIHQQHQLGKYIIIIQLKKRPNNPRHIGKQEIKFLRITEIITRSVFCSYSLNDLTFTFIF